MDLQAFYGGYGRPGDSSKAQRRHEAWCDGRGCENERCPKGKEWRAAHKYPLKTADGLRGEYEEPVQERRPEMLAQGSEAGKQEHGEGLGVLVPQLPQADRPGDEETRADAGQDQGSADSAEEIEQGNGPA